MFLELTAAPGMCALAFSHVPWTIPLETNGPIRETVLNAIDAFTHEYGPGFRRNSTQSQHRTEHRPVPCSCEST